MKSGPITPTFTLSRRRRRRAHSPAPPICRGATAGITACRPMPWPRSSAIRASNPSSITGGMSPPVRPSVGAALRSLPTATVASPSLPAPANARRGMIYSGMLGLSELTREVLEALHDPIVVLDTGGRVLLANRASLAVLPANAERKHISAVVRTPQLLEAVDRVLKGGAAETVAFAFLVPVERHYEAYVSSSGAGETPVCTGQLHDFPGGRRAEEMRADFIANASHELRTPLAAVSGFIDTLRGYAKDDAVARARFL